MPPAEIKDLRVWKQRGLTAEKLALAIQCGDPDSSDDILESKAPMEIAELWLRQKHTLEGQIVLRKMADTWYRYNGRHYAKIDTDTALRGGLYAFLRDKKIRVHRGGTMMLEKYEATRAKISDIIDSMNHSCPIVATPPCWLDNEEAGVVTDMISFKNGILHVPTLTMQPATSRLFTFASLPFDYNPTAECPLWLQFLSEIFPNDRSQIDLLQEWFGYMMVADISMEKMMVFLGRPGAGKSTVLDVLRCVLGDGQVASSSFLDLCNGFGLEGLVGKMAVFLTDASLPRQVDSTQALEVMKRIIGCDRVDVRRKHLTIRNDLQLTCRFTLSANEIPDLPDHTRALERRLNLIHFSECFIGKEDTTLKKRLPLEAEGVAIWALKGLRRLREQGVFTVPPSSAPMFAEFKRTISPLTEFVEDCCKLGAGGEVWVDKRMLFDAWRSWSAEHGSSFGTKIKFFQRLATLFPSCYSSRKMVNGESMSVITGIKLTEDSVSRYTGGSR
jgi:putative DNA primase/helicase